MNLYEDLLTEADLCRNEGADDIADLLDRAADAVIKMSALIYNINALLDAPFFNNAMHTYGWRDEVEAIQKIIEDVENTNKATGATHEHN